MSIPSDRAARSRVALRRLVKWLVPFALVGVAAGLVYMGLRWREGRGPRPAVAWAAVAPVDSLSFSLDGRTLGGVSDECGVVSLWHVDLQPEERLWFDRGKYDVRVAALSPETRRIASYWGGSQVGVGGWGPEQGRSLRFAGSPSDGLRSLCFSADGNTLAGTSGQSVHVWSLTGSRYRKCSTGEPGELTGLAVSPDGTLVAAGFAGGPGVRVWDVDSGRLRLSVETAGAVGALAFSAGDKALAWADGDTVVVWDLAANAVRGRRRSPGNLHPCLALTPDGDVVAVGHPGGVTLWEVATGATPLTLRAAGEPITAVCISPNGRLLAAASTGAKTTPAATVRLWELPRQQ